MIKFIKNIISLTILLSAGFFVVSVDSGGKTFRWLGETMKNGTDELAETADMIKKSSDEIGRAARETADSISMTSSRIKETGTKVAQKFEDTGNAVRDSAHGLRNLTHRATVSAKATEKPLGEASPQ